jgi:hypothetical protein
MEIDYIYKQILNRQYRWAKLFQNNSQRLLLSSWEKKPFEPEELIESLKSYFKDFPGTYKICLKRNATDKDSSMIVYDRVSVNDFTLIDGESHDKKESGLSASDLKKLKDSWKKEMLLELAAQKKQNDLQNSILEARRKEKELDTVAGKINYLLNKVLETHPVTKGILSGIKTEQNTGMAKTEPKDLNAYTQYDKDCANEALMRFLNVTNPEFLLEMAKKVEAKPELIQTLKNFL